MQDAVFDIIVAPLDLYAVSAVQDDGAGAQVIKAGSGHAAGSGSRIETDCHLAQSMQAATVDTDLLRCLDGYAVPPGAEELQAPQDNATAALHADEWLSQQTQLQGLASLGEQDVHLPALQVQGIFASLVYFLRDVEDAPFLEILARPEAEAVESRVTHLQRMVLSDGLDADQFVSPAVTETAGEPAHFRPAPAEWPVGTEVNRAESGLQGPFPVLVGPVRQGEIRGRLDPARLIGMRRPAPSKADRDALADD